MILLGQDAGPLRDKEARGLLTDRGEQQRLADLREQLRVRLIAYGKLTTFIEFSLPLA